MDWGVPVILAARRESSLTRAKQLLSLPLPLLSHHASDAHNPILVSCLLLLLLQRALAASLLLSQLQSARSSVQSSGKRGLCDC